MPLRLLLLSARLGDIAGERIQLLLDGAGVLFDDLIEEALLTSARLLAAATKLVTLHYSQFKGQLLVADSEMSVLCREVLLLRGELLLLRGELLLLCSQLLIQLGQVLNLFRARCQCAQQLT